jgi:hypothetical protein
VAKGGKQAITAAGKVARAVELADTGNENQQLSAAAFAAGTMRGHGQNVRAQTACFFILYK